MSILQLVEIYNAEHPIVGHRSKQETQKAREKHVSKGMLDPIIIKTNVQNEHSKIKPPGMTVS